MISVLAGWALLQMVMLPIASGFDIPITLYTDTDCVTPSTSATNVSLGIGVCAVTPGLSSFHLGSFPCLSGSVRYYIFGDTACGHTTDFTDQYADCHSAIEGGLAAVMLSCNQEDPEQPSSFTTINVGPIATAASSTLPAATGGGGDDSPNSGSGSGSSSESSPEAHGWDSLSLGTKLGIIISLAVGVPPILIGLWTVRYYRQRRRRAQSENNVLQSLASGYPQTHPGLTRATSGDSCTNSEHFHNSNGYPDPNTHFHPGMESRWPSPESPAERWNRYNYVTGGGMGDMMDRGLLTPWRS